MGALRGVAVAAGAAFVGAALAGLPPVRDGLDRLSERVERAARRPRRWDVIRGVRWYHEDLRLSRTALPAVVEGIVRARVTAMRPRERMVYAEAARRDARAALRRAGTDPARVPPPPVRLPTAPIRLDPQYRP